MKRETTNKIRFVLEDLLPPLLRDSFIFKKLAMAVWGNHIERLADFRSRAAELTSEEYESLYLSHPRVHDGTDNSEACISRIADEIVGKSVCDVGCGTGYLLAEINRRNPDLEKLVGVDFAVNDAASLPGVEYFSSKIECLPFPDNSFDTVVCTHVIEHILDYRQAISELRRIAARRLIVVVPREREYRYTFNPHFNFFPYTHSLLRAMAPLPATYVCEDVQRDLYYREDLSDSVEQTGRAAA